MTEKLEKRNWLKIVLESNGQLAFLPENFKSAAEEWRKLRDDYNKEVKVMAEKEMTLNMSLQNLFFGIRKHLAKNGYNDIFLKDIGFETTALEDGEFIISLIDAPSSQIPRR